MTTYFRESQFDVVLVSGPRLELWPTVGTRILSQQCSEAGLKVGVFGGEDIRVLGVLPVPSTGGFVIVQDVQGRIHRISARAVVKVSPYPQFPQPFPGWNSEGMLPVSSARKLLETSVMEWLPAVAILGTGNEALRFGNRLLEKFFHLGIEVYCIESPTEVPLVSQVTGWEVERRKFETLGGKILFADPVSLTPKAALRWEFRLKDHLGVRLLEVGRVVSAGPFSALPGVKEYPADSNLYELENTAHRQERDQIEGWHREVHYALGLTLKIIRALGVGEHFDRDKGEWIQRQIKRRIKQNQKYRESKVQLQFDGKWVSRVQWRELSLFDGVSHDQVLEKPVGEASEKKQIPKLGPMPSIECFEDIPCQQCADQCPESAITIDSEARAQNKILNPSLCTGCGICLSVCPSSSISSSFSFSKLHPESRSSQAFLWLVSAIEYPWKIGEVVQLLNRRGDFLGTGRIHEIKEDQVLGEPNGQKKRIKLEVPTHLVWEARGLRPKLMEGAEDRHYLKQAETFGNFPKWVENRVDVTLNGARRFMRDGVPASIAFFETGQARAEDVLLCSDQSCGLCLVKMDGVRKLACAHSVHRGMALQTKESQAFQLTIGSESENSSGITMERDELELCPCLGKKWNEIREKIQHSKSNSGISIKTVEAALTLTHIGEGPCHGQRCIEVFRRLLIAEGVEGEHWIDWRFPWRDWSVS